MEILSLLGIDQSIINQFCIVLVVFFLSKFLFLNKLQEVLENRENKTSKLLEKADKNNLKASELAEVYKQKIDLAYQQTQQHLQEKKSEIVQRESTQIKTAEKEAEKFVEDSLKDFSQELKTKKERLFAEVEPLASSLITKVTK